MVRFLCGVAAVWMVVGSAQAASPGFDCAKAGNAVEKAICASPELSALDGVLSGIFTDARKAASDDGKKTMEAEQKAWLKDRNACSKDQALATCLSASYVVRLKALQPQQAAAPGFDCAKAGSATEKRICGSQGLSALDGILSGIYLSARKAASEEDRKTMETAQKAWLKERNACKDTDCLFTLYGDRFASLRTATPPATSTSPQAMAAPTPLVPAPNTQPPAAPTPLMPAASAPPAANADWVGKIEANLSAIDGCIALTPAFPVMVSSLYTEKGILNVRLWASDGRAWSCLAGTNSTVSLLETSMPLAKGMTLFSRAPQAAFKGECVTSEKVMQGDVLLGWVSHKGC